MKEGKNILKEKIIFRFIKNAKNVGGNSNRGSSLLIVISIFALFMVLSMNLMLAAKATENGLSDEFETDRVNLYVNSVYKLVNQAVLSGDLPELFKVDATSESPAAIAFSGFDEPVEGKVYKNGNEATLELDITFKSKVYVVIARYEVTSVGTTLKGCDGIVKVE